MNLTQTLDLMLDGKGVSPERFAYLAGQLLSRGSVAREESQAQVKLYDEAFRVREVLEEYFRCVGLRLWHSPRLECFRLYPPTAGEGRPPGRRRLAPAPAAGFQRLCAGAAPSLPAAPGRGGCG